MYSTSKTAQIVKEMGNYKLDILGISECRWTGSGKMNTKNDKGESYTIIHSGQKDTHHRGVALIMNRESANTLMEWEPINERLIKARFNSKYCKFTIIQCYAPTNDSEDDMKEEWYDQLQAAVSKVPQHDVLLIMGDMNAKTGSDNTDRERAMGREGCGIINDNGEKFCELLSQQQLCDRRYHLSTQRDTQTNMEVTRWPNSKPDRPCSYK